MAATVVDFILEDLQQILSYGGNSKKNDEMESLYEELRFIRAFLSASEEIRNEHDHEELKMLVAQIKRVACEALNAFDISVLHALRQNYFTDHSTGHESFIQDIMSIKKKVMDIYRNNLYGIGLPPAEVPSSFENLSSPSLKEEDIVVGFDDETTRIMERLVGEKKQLQVVSIVGMAGIGKTTLAGKVYNDPCIVHHFYVRAWTYVSQMYRKRDLLMWILSCIVKKEDDICGLSEERLAGELYRSLKGKRYLILVDDIWNIEVWEDLKRSFPNDNNGSRIMITTHVALRVKKDIPLHVLCTLSSDESWDLLQQSVS